MGLGLRAKFKKIRNTRLIIDCEKRLGNFSLKNSGYDTTINKEEISRKFLLENPKKGSRFLDVGARDGKLTYLLGIRGNLNFDADFYAKNLSRFNEYYEYFGMDLIPSADKRVLVGDICDKTYLSSYSEYRESIDFIYSNNVLEHLKQPWVAVKNLWDMLKLGGICVTIVPFSQRYHASPDDYFRYTHKGLIALFENAGGIGSFEVLENGYDIQGRRNNWQGDGDANDIVPTDSWGAWRETWFAVLIFRKKTAAAN